MAGEITYPPVEADYVTAHRTGFACSVRNRRTLRAQVIVMAACGVIGALVALQEQGWGPRALVIAGFLAWGALTMPLCWGLSYLLIPRRARRQFGQQRSLRSPWTYRWSDTGFENESVTGIARYGRADLHAWARTRSMLLFHVNDQLFRFLPTRALEAAQGAELEILLEAHGVTRC